MPESGQVFTENDLKFVFICKSFIIHNEWSKISFEPNTNKRRGRKTQIYVLLLKGSTVKIII